MKTIYLTVALSIPDDADSLEYVQELDYSFSYEGQELQTEIIDVNNEDQ